MNKDFSLIAMSMEGDVLSAQNYARALVMAGQTLEEEQALSICQLAGDILDRLAAIEEKRIGLLQPT